MLLIYLPYTDEMREKTLEIRAQYEKSSWRAPHAWKGEIEVAANAVITNNQYNQIAAAYESRGFKAVVLGQAESKTESATAPAEPNAKPEQEPPPGNATPQEEGDMIAIKDPNDNRRRLLISRDEWSQNPQNFVLWER